MAATNPDVTINDMGFKRATDRLAALRRTVATVGIWRPKSVAKYAAIWERRKGWKTAADLRQDRHVARHYARLQADIVDGNESYAVIIKRFSEAMADYYREQILGGHGTPKLYRTGAMYRAVKTRLSGVPKI